MAPDVCGGLRNCGSSGKNRHVLKKGPWTTSEDMLLLEYVKKHGEGNWNAVQRNSGLLRCGKSCRLRWANHLRPNLKKGAFTPDEENLIVELHSKLGNKWARMAAQLPGRTDNEIKNYWNTRLKRRQRAGLPIYPHESAQQEQQLINSNSQTVPSLSSILAPRNPSPFTFTPPMIIPLENRPNPPYLNHQLDLYGDDHGSTLTLSLNASNSRSPFSHHLPMASLVQFNSLSYGGLNSGPEMGVFGLNSIQSPVQGAVTPAASSSDQFVKTATSSCDGAEEYDQVERGFQQQRNRSGLLEDLFEESQALVYGGKLEEPYIAADPSVDDEAPAFGFRHDNYQGLEAKAPKEGIAAMDDDLMNLLDNFPLSVPIPNWNGEDGSESPILTNGTSNGVESRPDSSEYNPVANSTGAADQDWKFGSCHWNNMPIIY